MKVLSFCFAVLVLPTYVLAASLTLNEKGYFEMPGLEVTSFADYYPEGHQTGVTIIQHGVRVAANGDVRLEASPGQWSPVPKKVSEEFDRKQQVIRTHLAYPNEAVDRKGFNPVVYPDLNLEYSVEVQALGENRFAVTVNLVKPLPAEWVGKVGFNFELFPGDLFGKSYWMDGKVGQFPVQPNGPLIKESGVELTAAMASGHKLLVAPENALQRIAIESETAPLFLLDGRSNHNNSWFIVRSLIPAGKTDKALRWTLSPHVEKDWRYKPVLQVSQVGYGPQQAKKLVIEQDRRDSKSSAVTFYRIDAKGEHKALKQKPAYWGEFLRYRYYTVDFTALSEEGLYVAEYRGQRSHAFQISKSVFARHVWQPTLEYFLPVQMCHMRVVENYRVWHDHCHEDDARMSPLNHNHFDGYISKESTLSSYKPGAPVPGLNKGGWHDAGDYDLRVESQIGTVWRLAAMIEEFGLDYDSTHIDQTRKLVEIHKSDGISDALQQVEHGLLTVMGGYQSLGRLYRGIIVPSIDQYVMLGDAGAHTDGKVDLAPAMLSENLFHSTNGGDDRWVFTEDNPDRELYVAAGLAAASRVLREYNPKLSADSLQAAKQLYRDGAPRAQRISSKVFALTELLLSVQRGEAYREELATLSKDALASLDQTGWMLARVQPMLKGPAWSELDGAMQAYQGRLQKEASETPYGVPYKPNIWGAGWTIQEFGVKQYFMHKAWPSLASAELYMNALNFVLGVHPGENSMSFVSGVGSESALVAYGVNRADWSFIPGGSVSGTALIRPDLPELKIWPYFWQQTEYVMGGGATNFMFLAMAANATVTEK